MLLLIEDPKLLKPLRHLVFKICFDQELRKDLMQEALPHVWKFEVAGANNTTDWYLTSCRFYLHDFLGQGCSIDSLKHGQPLSDPVPSEDSGGDDAELEFE